MHELGEILDSYRLLALCGTGAYGEVYRAVNTLTQKQVALKILPMTAHGERELKCITQYQEVCFQTNLLHLYHVGSNDSEFWYTMDLADNLLESEDEYMPDTLSVRLQRDGRMLPEDIRNLAEHLLEQIKTLHDLGILHRDIKPDNIIWRQGEPILGDIGLATKASAASVAGTPRFMRPQTLAELKPYDQSDDYFALGKVIYCAFTGCPVEDFPSLPPDLSLDGNEDIVRLYNHLVESGCSGLDDAFAKESPRLKSRLVKGAVMMIAVLAAAWGLYHGMAGKREVPAEEKGRENATAENTPSEIKNDKPLSADTIVTKEIANSADLYKVEFLREKELMEGADSKEALNERFDVLKKKVHTDAELIAIVRRKIEEMKARQEKNDLLTKAEIAMGAYDIANDRVKWWLKGLEDMRNTTHANPWRQKLQEQNYARMLKDLEDDSIKRQQMENELKIWYDENK